MAERVGTRENKSRLPHWRVGLAAVLLFGSFLLLGCSTTPIPIVATEIRPVATSTATVTSTITPTETETATSTVIPTIGEAHRVRATETATPGWAKPKVIVECCSSSGERLALLLTDPKIKERVLNETGVEVLSTGIGGLDYLGVEQNLDKLFPPGFVPPGAVVELDGPAKNGELQGLTPEQNFSRLKSLLGKMQAHLQTDKNHILIVVDQVRASAMPDQDLTVKDDEFNAYLEAHFSELGPGSSLGKIHTCYEFPGTGRTDPRYYDSDGLHFPGIEGYIQLIKVDEMLLAGGSCP